MSTNLGKNIIELVEKSRQVHDLTSGSERFMQFSGEFLLMMLTPFRKDAKEDKSEQNIRRSTDPFAVTRWSILERLDQSKKLCLLNEQGKLPPALPARHS